MIETYLTSLGLSNIKPLNGFHNHVFEAVDQHTPVIVRVSDRREQADIEAEIDLLLNIKTNVHVSKPHKINHHFVHQHKAYVVACFKKEKGKNWHETTLTNQTHYNVGRELGLLHLALQGRKGVKRERYDKHPDIQLVSSLESHFQNELKRVLNDLDALNKTSRSYGLIHGDFLFSNMLYEEDKITIIDFDDIEHNFYMYDIAVYLFYLLLGGDPSNMDIDANIDVFNHFMKGYLSVNQQTALDFNHIDLFFRLRQLKLLATIKTKMDEARYRPWQKAYIALIERQVKENQPFIDIPYQKLYQALLK